MFPYTDSAARLYVTNEYAQPVMQPPGIQYCFGPPYVSTNVGQFCYAAVPPGAVQISNQEYFQTQSAVYQPNGMLQPHLTYYPAPPVNVQLPNNAQVQATVPGPYRPRSPQMGYPAPSPIFYLPPSVAPNLSCSGETLVSDPVIANDCPCGPSLQPPSITKPVKTSLPQIKTTADNIDETFLPKQVLSSSTPKDPIHRVMVAQQLQQLHPKYKTKPCTNFSKYGHCPFGDHCQFIHTDDLLTKDSLERTDIKKVDSQKENSSGFMISKVRIDLSQRLCSSTPISWKTLKQPELAIDPKQKRTYRQNFSPGVGCKKPSVVDGVHPRTTIQTNGSISGPEKK